jgi:hypothetical protein
MGAKCPVERLSLHGVETLFSAVHLKGEAMENNNVALGIMFLWLLTLTVAFVLHWIKIERHHTFDQQWGTKVSANLRSKILGG